MPKIQFDVNIANGIAIDIANDVLLVWWMDVHVYPFRFNQFKSLLHVEIKWLNLVSFERPLLVEYACQTWSLYLLRLKSYYSKCLSWQQTNKQTDRTKTFDPGAYKSSTCYFVIEVKEYSKPFKSLNVKFIYLQCIFFESNPELKFEIENQWSAKRHKIFNHSPNISWIVRIYAEKRKIEEW